MRAYGKISNISCLAVIILVTVGVLFNGIAPDKELTLLLCGIVIIETIFDTITAFRKHKPLELSCNIEFSEEDIKKIVDEMEKQKIA